MVRLPRSTREVFVTHIFSSRLLLLGWDRSNTQRKSGGVETIHPEWLFSTALHSPTDPYEVVLFCIALPGPGNFGQDVPSRPPTKNEVLFWRPSPSLVHCV